MGCSVRPSICNGAQPGLVPQARMQAPICSSGAMMRPIGRLLSEASPNMREEKGRAANMPAISRIPVPELPQSISCAGAAGFIPVPYRMNSLGSSASLTYIPPPLSTL